MLTDGAECAAVANIQDVDILIHYQDDDGARACLVVGLVGGGAHKLQELLFRLV